MDKLVPKPLLLSEDGQESQYRKNLLERIRNNRCLRREASESPSDKIMEVVEFMVRSLEQHPLQAHSC